jgi:lyso-ornithine lipid O-acyltransferase
MSQVTTYVSSSATTTWLLPRRWRQLGRLLAFCTLVLTQWIRWLLFISLPGRSRSLSARAAWLNSTCRRLLSLLGLAVRYIGEPPAGGLLVCNHLSYLDVIALAARAPIIFVAKREVRSWPGLGPLVACAGTIFVDRERRSDVVRAGREIEMAVRQGVLVCLFAEGTSSNGTEVLPFRSSLLAPAVANGWPVAFAGIGYELSGGSVENEICYWGEMVLGPHLLNVLSKRSIKVCIRYGAPVAPGSSRKKLAALLRSEVAATL